MTRKTAPFIYKIGEEIIEILFTNIARNIELANDKEGATVQSFIDSLKLELKNISEQIAEKLSQDDIINNLVSDDTDKALSAAQGKLLYTRIVELEKLIESQSVSIKDIDDLSLHTYNYSPLVRDDS